MAWKLSVVHWAPNFARGYPLNTTLTSAVSSGSASIVVNDSVSKYCLQRGDILKLGPSTYSSDIGREEHARVSHILGSTIYLEDALAYGYSVGDSVSGVGHGFAEGWSVANTGNSTVTFEGIFPKGGSDGEITKGFTDIVNVQRISLQSGTTGYVRIQTSMYRDLLLSQTPYRSIVYYSSLSGGGNNCTHAVYDYGEHSFILTYPSNNTLGNWIKLEAYGTTSLDLSAGTTPRIIFHWNAPAYFSYFLIGFVALTHAALTEGQSSGVYTIPVSPIDVRKQTTGLDRSTLIRGNKTVVTSALDFSVVREYSLIFVDVDKSFVRQLEIFNYWQNLGYLLLLESDISSEKPLIGVMDYRIRYSHWDLTNFSVEFVFRGI